MNQKNHLLTGWAVLLFAFLLPAMSCQQETKYSDEQQLFVSDTLAIAQTEYGKVKGFILREIIQFRGIPYGASTAGSNRFMPPQPPEPWEGILPTVWWGNSAPQIMEGRYAHAYASFVDHWNYDEVSEDCLRLNVWTPALNDGKKRPVLLWLHGGGYTNGNGIEQDGYDGENLSRKGDIVFVSINHRLGPLGFSDLSGVGGEKYRYSGNAGVLDMLFALEWVNRNIENFGGDPGNVTIMGQSGGGAKVCNLVAMEQTRGLVHKAIPLSGSTIQSIGQDYARQVGAYILREAGLEPSEVDQLQELSWLEYIHLANRAARKCAQENPAAGQRGFGPVADGDILPAGQYFSDPQGAGSKIPMLLCTTFHEWGMARTQPELETISAEKAIEMLKERAGFRGGLGDKAEVAYRAYERVFPEAKPIEIMTLVASNRKGVIETANAKARQEAPVYLAWFGWEPPLFDQRMRAFHCLDICFWLANTDIMLTHTGGGKRPRVLADKMSDALLNFMKTGNPNGGDLPYWPAYTTEKGETMILDDVSMVKNDPDREARAQF
ncbi:MAG TPA: carboxylesterase family protein [Prolixibacteraceae bacterium]|nr:carboxylesterase family protein [Prolixibacteraceae bacterium]